ncbi:MAG: hypothetical protein ACXADY_00170 [Candidatus Hodarchaeales archaeon]
MTKMHKNRLYRVGWKLWICQNLVILIPFIAFVPLISHRIFSFFASQQLENAAAKWLNTIFSFALLLDLISITIISTSTLLYFSNLRKEDDLIKKEFLLPLSGFLWIIFSFLWRIPFFISGGFDLGFSQSSWWLLSNNQFYTTILNNLFVLILQIFAAFCLLYFLYSQENYIEGINQESRYIDISAKFGRATIFGLLNVIGVLMIVLGSNIFSGRSIEMIETYGRGTSGILLLMGIMIKIPTLPILALWTSLKFLSVKNLPEISVDKESESPILEHIS